MELRAEDIKLTGSKPCEKDGNDPDTLLDALETLKAQGFTYNFKITSHVLELCSDEGIKLMLNPEDFDIVKVFRFEGIGNPSGTSVLYAIESGSDLKGTLVSSYGV